MAINITPLSNALGAEVTGIDLRKPITEEDRAALNAALPEHLVLVIRDQKLEEPDDFITASRNFGETMDQYLTEFLMKDHPEICVIDSREAPIRPNGTPRLVGSNHWHTDHTNTEEPPKATVLFAVKLPSSGGTTGFADMRKAYAALPEEERARLDGMTTVNKLIEEPAYVSADSQKAYSKPCIHPLIRTHPETGEKAIWVGQAKCESIDDMDPEETQDFITDLLARTVQPAVTYIHEWSPGDLVIWDNRASLHKAFADYDHTEGRVMYRIILKGDKPF
jgi:taurine dioxygenase